MRKTVTKDFSTSIVVNKDASGEDEKTITVIACDPSRDRDGEEFDTKSLKVNLRDGVQTTIGALKGDEALDVPWFLDHGRSIRDLIGSTRSFQLLDGDKLQLTGGISSVKDAQEAWTKAKEGHLGNNVSVTYAYDDTDVIDDKYVGAELLEVSLVWKGSNRNAAVVGAKSLEGEEMPKQANKDAEGVNEALDVIATATADFAATVQDAVGAARVENGTEEGDEETGAENDTTTDSENTESAKEVEEETKNAEESEDTTDESEKEETVTNEERRKELAKAAKTPEEQATVPKAKQVSPTDSQSTNDFKKFAVKYIGQKLKNEHAKAAGFAEKAKKSMTSKMLLALKDNNRFNYGDAEDAGILVQAQIDADVASAAEDIGGLTALVTHKSISGSSYRKIIRNATNRFEMAGFGSATVNHPNKAVKKPSFGKFEKAPKPWALVYYWDDEMAEDSAIDIYNEMVQELAEGKVRTEEYLIASFDGGTSGVTTYEATGLLVNTNVPTQTAVYDTTFAKSLAEAIGKAKNATSNRTLVMNSLTLGKVGSITDTNGRTLFTGGSQSVDLGLLGQVKVVTSDQIPDDKMILGDFKKYYLVEKGGLQITTSRDATIEDMSLFLTDGTAVRGRERYDGGPLWVDAFVNITGSDVTTP